MEEQKPQAVAGEIVPTEPVVEKQEIVARDPGAMSVEVLISKAIENGMTAETMEKFLAMRRELRAEAAKEAYDAAMAAFQAECPVIEKTKEAKDGTRVLYKYAPIDAIVEQVGAFIGKHGFSYSFRTDNKTDRVTVTCIVKHRGGHSEESTMETSLATKTGIMSGPQQIASTVTFNKRYAFCNAFGITTGDEDTDAAGKTGPALATPEQRVEIVKLATLAGLTTAQVVARSREKYGVAYDQITAVQADGIIAGLKVTIANKKP